MDIGEVLPKITNFIRNGESQKANSLLQNVLRAGSRSFCMVQQVVETPNGSGKPKENVKRPDLCRLKIKIEHSSAVTSNNVIYLSVPMDTTVEDLKKMIQRDLKIKRHHQEFIFGQPNSQAQKKPKDKDTLTTIGLANSQTVWNVFLYIKRCKGAEGDCFCKEDSTEEVGKLSLSSEDFNATSIAPATLPRWKCEHCHCQNLPYRPGCQVCTEPRPESYKPPLGYLPTIDEQKFIFNEQDSETLAKQFLEDERESQKKEAQRNYQRYKEADDAGLVSNVKEFECDTCMSVIAPGEGLLLRNCAHDVCKECFVLLVTNAEGGEVKCPTCSIDVQQREIKAVVDNATFEKYQRSYLNRAEQALPNSYHCRSANCEGFCEIDDKIDEFKCQVCHHLNCIRCRAIHEGKDCTAYQNELRLNAKNDADAKATLEAIEQLLTNGEAMKCPHCGILIFKKEGCDWLLCSCKTELCWATKGPRWGPKGRGDTSGGCKCKVGGKSCSPNCRNCH